VKDPVVFFEISVSNLDRAIRFYSAVFDCALERLEIDGNAMAKFPLLEHSGGITGALAQGESYVPGKQDAAYRSARQGDPMQVVACCIPRHRLVSLGGLRNSKTVKGTVLH
jgi:predicted enzyme related to lactoylglutathione lyase